MGRVISDKLKAQIPSEFCYYCGRKVNYKNKSFDHIIPVDKGGETSLKNIVCSCIDCNQLKGNMTIFELLKQLDCQKSFCDDEVRMARLEYHHKIFSLARDRLSERNTYPA